MKKVWPAQNTDKLLLPEFSCFFSSKPWINFGLSLIHWNFIQKCFQRHSSFWSSICEICGQYYKCGCIVFLKMGHSWPLFPYFRHFYLNVQFVDKILPFLGFEPRISGVEINRSTNWAEVLLKLLFDHLCMCGKVHQASRYNSWQVRSSNSDQLQLK